MTIQLTVYPDECDAFGHLNQASYLALFERARWELLARGPGMDVFTRAGVWPAVRRVTIDYLAGAWPGDVLAFTVELTGRGRTSFTLKQRAERVSDGRLVATAELVFVCIDHDERPVEVPPGILAALTESPRRVTLPSGVTYAVDERGEGDTAVLFLHGYPLDRTLWRAQFDGLRGHRLLAPDLRGFGGSEHRDPPRTLEAHADELAALCDALGVRRVIPVGLSMGGYLALAFAERHRERLAGLVLMDTRASADDEAGRANRDAAIATAERDGASAIADAMAPKLFAEQVESQVRDGIVRVMRAAPVAGITAALAAMRDRADRTALLPTLTGLPVLVMVGTEDRLTPPDAARAMAAAIPGAELVEVEGAGHLPPVERPATVTESLQRFLDRV